MIVNWCTMIQSASERTERDEEAEEFLLMAALLFCDLREARPARQPTVAELEQAEKQAGVPQEVFQAMLAEDPSDKWGKARRNLEIAKNDAPGEQRTTALDELLNIDIGPAFLRKFCKIVANVLIGPPLGKPIGALVGHLLAELARPPAEPTTNPGAPVALSLADLVLHQSDEPGGMPDPDELPSPWSPEPPDREPPSGPKGPGGP